tara:strand:- start:1300 stop:1746 length:447 start_codon:yes stop_codon:yes gene_type:complete
MYKETIAANEHIFVYYVNAIHKLAMNLKQVSNQDDESYQTYNISQKNKLAIASWDICMLLQPTVILDYIVSRNADEYKSRLICNWSSIINLRSHHEWCKYIFKERETAGRLMERGLNRIRSSKAQVQSISIGRESFEDIIQNEIGLGS